MPEDRDESEPVEIVYLPPTDEEPTPHWTLRRVIYLIIALIVIIALLATLIWPLLWQIANPPPPPPTLPPINI